MVSSPVGRIRTVISRPFELRLWAALAYLGLNLALLAACIAAFRQNVNLKFQLTRAVTMITPQPGAIAPPLIGVNRGGGGQWLGYGADSRPTVIFTFEKNCPYCSSYWATVRELQRLAPHLLRLVYVDTHDDLTAKYLATNGVRNAPVLTKLAPEAALAYRALLLPQIELLDSEGRVQWSHAGELAPEGARQFLSLVKKDQPNQRRN